MLLMYQFIIMLSPIYNNFTFGPIEDIGWSNRGNRGHDWTVLLFFLNTYLNKFINDFLVINSLLLKINYKLCVSILFTSIPFVFAFIFKFIVRGPNPGNSPLLLLVHRALIGREPDYIANYVSRRLPLR